jgi:hypothetical protein
MSTAAATTSCPSLRFVEPGSSVALANLAALWASAPALAERVEAVRLGPRVCVVPAKNGEPTLSVQPATGRPIQLHSRYDPSAEAAKLVERIENVEGLAYFVLGMGLGYAVEQLVKRLPTTAHVWIIEPDVEVIRAACEHRSLDALIANPRVKFITVIDRPALLTEFQQMVAVIHTGVTVMEHAPSVQLSPTFFNEARAWIDELKSYAKTALNTLVLNAGKTLGNIARNIGRYATSPGPQRLAGAFKGEPAIIVSAGPSLRKNKHLLREAKGKAVIIAVQTTLKPLLEIGVEPDFVTSLDYSEISSRFFQDLPENLATELVAEAKATDAIFGLHPGPVTLVGNEMADDLLRGVFVPRPRLRSGATVAHLAFYLAEYLGCDPIVFVGQDLGFSDGLCYTPGTSYDEVWRPEIGRFCTMEMKQWEQIARDRPILRKIADAQGRPMYTEQRLFTYLQQFERDFAVSKARIIDASEGGAAKRGAYPMRLQDALERFCTKPLRGRLAPHAGSTTANLPLARKAIETRVSEAQRIADIASQVAPLLEEIRDHLDEQPRVNRAIARIDPLREQMNTFGRTYDLVMYLSQQTEYDRFKTDMAIGGREAKPMELQRRQTQRDLENVRAVIDAARRFESLMGESLALIDLECEVPA